MDEILRSTEFLWTTGERFIARCAAFHEPGTRVYQLVDQLRQEFWRGCACKCDTCKALGFPDFSTTNQKVWGSNLSGAHLFHLVTSRHALVVFRSSSIVTEL